MFDLLKNNFAVSRFVADFGAIYAKLLDNFLFTGNFTAIHRGNTKHDRSSCILVGESRVIGKVIYSTLYEKRLVDLLTAIRERDETIRMETGNYKPYMITKKHYS
ncbi:MAG: hypothetical protein LBB90_11780 [Tannerella sp.]|jgi:hypothetical protein|nr:hypothetical protein [Tannerella sp.]